MAIKGGAPRPSLRAKRWWIPLTKGSERSFDPTLSQTRSSNGRKPRGQRRPRSVPRSNLGRKCCTGECPNRRPRVTGGGENTHIRLVPHSSLAKQSNNAMMSSISPSGEQTGSKAKKSWKSLYDERMASLPTVGLTSSDDYPEITHPDVNFTPCPRK